ncbi:MAG: biotin carboxylase N-terminal domain-containing protein [Paludibacter sp.]|nr:biotin carboxylase N-terminal domain-containing protein [Paludibacter sp.]MDD4197857.1 biotin carboxylase N-terminal domain-containing protein [Paludibacter sp.]MDD4428153.1 biotin carboxylase N-terminal domain-containing protein [Paludibacter sp.]
MKKRLLIANRSEIAIRIIRSAHKMGMYAIVFQSDKEPDALYLKFADEIIDAHDADDEKPIFLNPNKIVAFALEHEVDLIHPGYGFLSENPDFVALCISKKLNFIGPSPELIRDMGLKTVAKKMAIEAGLPLVPGSEGPVADVLAAKEYAASIGYPVILKASAGGGGRGMRIVENSETIERNFKSAYDEALAAFGNGDIFIEKYLQNPKHLEFQILGDKHGNVIHLGERECSLQRKHQKIIEEAPSASVTETMRKEMGTMAVRFAQKIGYYSAGTIEFIMDEDGSYYFMEMNTRIQVEHPVTEMITGVDLVDWQIRIALDEVLTLKQEDIIIKGWAIECRVNAEDPQNRFTPQTGFIDKIQFPQDASIRIETGFLSGSMVTPYFDSMIAKIIVHGESRSKVINKTMEALNKFNIIGIKTTAPFCKAVLQHPYFKDASYTTRWVDLVYSPEMLEDPDDEMIGALAATIMYASEYLQLQGDIPAYENDALNVWVLNKRLNY